MKRREFLKIAAAGAASMSLPGCSSLVGGTAGGRKRKPNFIVIFADDLGYGDLSCYGSEKIKTPVIDQMAVEGIRFTDFWATCSVCSPSRASLLTGRYPQRCGVPYAVGGVYSDLGLQASEITIAKLLKTKGYATAAIGKWHLGIPQGFNYTTHEGFSSDSEFHPLNHGFDLFYGAAGNAIPGGRIPLINNETVIDPEMTVATITDKYIDKTIEFLAPWIAHPRFEGKSAGGIYGDMVEEVDASTGRILQALKDLNLDEDTLVVFASDNGAAYTPDQRYGSNLPCRGGKAMTWDGGQREPGIFRWPGQIPPGQISDEMINIMDIFPTFTKLAGVKLPTDRVIDGADIWPLLTGVKNAKSPHKVFYYYHGLNLQAVREGKWKLHLPRERKNLVWWDGGLLDLKEPMLFDLQADIGEKNDVAAQHPDVVKRLLQLANKARNELGSWDKPGYDQKPIRHLMDDRIGLGVIRNQQGHDKLGIRKIDPTIPTEQAGHIEQGIKVLSEKLGKNPQKNKK